MATTDELLKAAESEEETTDNTLVIDWDTREITIPDSIPLIGVEHDKDSNRLYFKCPATYGEFDISTFGIRVFFGNYSSSGSEITADAYIVDDAASDGEYITFSWLVGSNAYVSKGYVSFIVCCKYLDADGNVANDLNTTLATLPVLEGRDCNIDEIVQENYSDIYAALVALQKSLNTSIEAANAATEAATEATEAAETATTAANEATEAATEATESANTAVKAIYDDKNFLLLLNDDNTLSLTYNDEE